MGRLQPLPRASYSGKAYLKEGKGDSGDINLNYIAALNHLGIPTSPVILSTRGSGTLHPFYPDFSDFNYVFALSTIGEKLYFSDATSGLPFEIFPIDALMEMVGLFQNKEQTGYILKRFFQEDT
ncbi:MAG: hypothetical protein IPJ13_17085 [Saprospiraceae bacterium]|nr:hypothetical protein [Saprospiraceae bacterium]